jgi:hypothetical protein
MVTAGGCLPWPSPSRGWERRGLNGHKTGNGRLGVQLLTQAATSQAHRVTTGPGPSTSRPGHHVRG